MGPFDTEAEISALPEVRAIYAAFNADPGAGKMAPHTRQMLGRVLEAAGVAMGAYDDRIADWLARWEPQTVAVIAGWVTRARAAECGLLRADALSESSRHHATLAQLAQAQDEVGRLRAELAGTQGEPVATLSAEQVRSVLDALDVAADAKRDRVATCPDCEVAPAGLCTTCEWRLDAAERYDAIARHISEEAPVTSRPKAERDQAQAEMAGGDGDGDGQEPYCTHCGEWVGLFVGLEGWRHYRGDPAPGGPRELFDAGHEPVIGWIVPPRPAGGTDVAATGSAEGDR